MLSVMMTCIPILQLICYSSCACDAGNLPYKHIVIALSVLIIIGTSMVINGLNKDKTSCTNEGTKDYAIGVLSFSIILLAVMGFSYTPQWKNFFSKSDKGSVDSIVSPKMTKVKMDFSY